MSYEEFAATTPEEIIVSRWGVEGLISFVDHARCNIMNEKVRGAFRKWYDHEHKAGRVRSFEDFGAYLECSASTANRYYNGKILNTDYLNLDGYLRRIGTSLQQVLPTEQEERVAILSETIREFLILRGLPSYLYSDYLPLSNATLDEFARLVAACPMKPDDAVDHHRWARWVSEASRFIAGQAGAIKWGLTGGPQHILRSWVKAIAIGDWQAASVHLPWQVMAVLAASTFVTDVINLTGGVHHTGPSREGGPDEAVTVIPSSDNLSVQIPQLYRKTTCFSELAAGKYQLKESRRERDGKHGATVTCRFNSQMEGMKAGQWLAQISIELEVPVCAYPPDDLEATRNPVGETMSDELVNAPPLKDREIYSAVVRFCAETMSEWLERSKPDWAVQAGITADAIGPRSIRANLEFAMNEDVTLGDISEIQNSIASRPLDYEVAEFATYFWSNRWKKSISTGKFIGPIQPKFGTPLVSVLCNVQYVVEAWEIPVAGCWSVLRALMAYDSDRAERSQLKVTKILAAFRVLGERIDTTFQELARREAASGRPQLMSQDDLSAIQQRWRGVPPNRRPQTVGLQKTLEKMNERRFVAGHRTITELHLGLALVDDNGVASLLAEQFGIDCEALRESLRKSIADSPASKVLEAWFGPENSSEALTP